MSDSITGLDLRMPLACYGDDRSTGKDVATLKGGHLYYLPHDDGAIWLPAVPGTPWSAVACNIKMVAAEDLDALDLQYSYGIRSTGMVSLSPPLTHVAFQSDLVAWAYTGIPSLVAAMVRGELNKVESGDWFNK